jgi:hypothetical protein
MRVEFEMDGYLVTATVKEISDPYGTGNSKTIYEVDITKLVEQRTGRVVDEKELSEALFDSMIDEAIDVFKE